MMAVNPLAPPSKKRKIGSKSETQFVPKPAKLSSNRIDKKTSKSIKKTKTIKDKTETQLKTPQKLNDESFNKKAKFSKTDKKGVHTGFKKGNDKKNASGNFKNKSDNLEDIKDWAKFKKEKKELKLKRKQTRAKEGFDIILKAKSIGEELRKKTIKGGEQARIQLINELHSLLKGHYPRFVLAHDTARLVQWLLKYSSNIVIQQIANELVPITVTMMQSKYGIYCVKHLLKYGSSEVKTQIVSAMLGNVVKLASHAVSSSILENAYSKWATPVQKRYFIQEFFGDLYKQSKDDNVKHLRDTYQTNPSLKLATLGATKANLLRILSKSLLDSSLVQTVLFQFLSDCSEEDRAEFISQLAPHVVIISNSKDGARVAMNCIWNGKNKDKKVIMKAMKEHIVDLSKHEHGHSVVIALLDAIDDTVLLHKIILSDILKNAKDLAINEWGRKVIFWLVTPADTAQFHPVFISELDQGRTSSNCKKPTETRRQEILDYSVSPLLELVIQDTQFWLSTASLTTLMTAILKTGTGDILEKTYNNLVDAITNPEWTVQDKEKEVLGIEHPGMHMMLKKLIQHDKINSEKEIPTFSNALVQKLDKVLSVWLTLNRGCFLLVAIFENGTKEVRKPLKKLLKNYLDLLKKQKTTGAKILLNKFE